MPHRQSKTVKRRTTQNGQRKLLSDVFADPKAANVLADKPNLTEKSKVHKPKKVHVKKDQLKARLYGAPKKERVYTDKELNIPALNTTVIAGKKIKKGKKGKKFVGDHDTLLLSRIVESINDKYEVQNESKLEKAERLEKIRELKRKEIERKEKSKSDALEAKKTELKSKASAARLARRKRAKADKKEEEAEAEAEAEATAQQEQELEQIQSVPHESDTKPKKKKKKSVSFA